MVTNIEKFAVSDIWQRRDAMYVTLDNNDRVEAHKDNTILLLFLGKVSTKNCVVVSDVESRARRIVFATLSPGVFDAMNNFIEDHGYPISLNQEEVPGYVDEEYARQEAAKVGLHLADAA